MNLNNKQVIKATSFIQITRGKNILLYARSQCHQCNPTGKTLTDLSNEILTLLSQAPTAFCDKVLTLSYCSSHVHILFWCRCSENNEIKLYLHLEKRGKQCFPEKVCFNSVTISFTVILTYKFYEHTVCH